jgi:hypothetical protein
MVALGAAVFLLPAGASGRPVAPMALITPAITGTLGANGWYTSNVTLSWLLDPSVLNSNGCDAITFVTDTRDTPRTCSADFPGSIHVEVTVHIHRDATPPVVGAAPSRPADSNGWYNHPVTVGFTGSDVTSGIDTCSQATYGGPDNASASVAGTCRDRAGNVTLASYVLNYDTTPPALGALIVKAGNRKAHLRWKTPADASSVELARAPGLKGAAESVVFQGTALSKAYTDRKLRPGRNYVYRLTARDAAANQATKTREYVARGPLLNPAPGERVSRPPLLVWERVRGASYYNVILVRGRRILSAWPLRTRFRLPRAWTYHGRRYKLRPGTYSWFVWPGRGALSAGNYGKMLGGSTFTFGGSS